MKVNGESIYATTASPFRRLPWGQWQAINVRSVVLKPVD
jgi:hypothetical protein